MPITGSLSLKYRPHRLDELVGQKSTHLFLSKAIEKNRIPSALLFAGNSGCGKTSAARAFAATLNCSESNGPCNNCVSCKAIFDGISTDVLEIDAASNGGVDNIRNLREQILYSSTGNYRVVILDECQQVSNEGFNALLKTLEEPPERTVFILLTTEPDKILKTIVGRCAKYTFNKISVMDIVGRLKFISEQEGFTIDNDLLKAIAEKANGSMRDAVMTLDQVVMADIDNKQSFEEFLGEADYGPQLLKLILQGNYGKIYESIDEYMMRTGDSTKVVNQLIQTIRDIIVLNSGCSLSMQGQAVKDREELVPLLSENKCLKVLEKLWDLKTKVKGVEDQRAMLDIAVALITDTLCDKVVVENIVPAKKLTLSDMKSLQR